MCDTVLELNNNFLDKHFHEYYDLEKETKEKLGYKFKPINLKIKGYGFGKLYNETSDKDYDDYDDYEEEHIDLSDIPQVERDEEEVKVGKGLKVFTPNKLLTRLLTLLAQIKAGNSSCKLKNEIRQILYQLYNHDKITKNVYNNLIKSF